MKDKRIKGCSNTVCEYNQDRKKHYYFAEDKFCSRCGSDLVFICAKCFGPLHDGGPTHKTCERCQAEIDDRKVKAKKYASRIGTVAGTLGAGFVTVAKNDKLKKIFSFSKFIKQ